MDYNKVVIKKCTYCGGPALPSNEIDPRKVKTIEHGIAGGHSCMNEECKKYLTSLSSGGFFIWDGG